MYNSQNHNKISLKWHEIVRLMYIFEYFHTFVFFGIITLGSARSQKTFLDKHSGTCQKSSCFRKSTDLRRNVQFSKSQRIQSKMAWNRTFYMQFRVFLHFCVFWYNHIGPCEISENFSWQTIWDLSEEFQLQEIYRSEEESGFLKIKGILYEIAYLYIFMYDFPSIFIFRVFLYYHIGLCEISEKISWQTIWDLSEEFQLQEIYRSEEESGFLKFNQFALKMARFYTV